MRETYESNVADFDDQSRDNKVYVKFYLHPAYDEAQSVEQGRPIYHDKEYIEIRTPGNETNVVRRPVSDIEKRRFAQQYRAFKAGELEQTIGTPLSEVPWVTRSQVEELSYVKIRTVEMLAEVNDDVCTRIPGLFELKRKAQAYVEKALKNAPVLKVQQENEELRNALATLEETVKSQGELIASLKAQAQGAKK